MNMQPVYFAFAVVFNLIGIALTVLPSTPCGLY